MTAVPLADAARTLGVSVTTLRRWMDQGAPVARRGRPGHGCPTLVVPEAVEAWRAAQDGSGDVDAALRALAGHLPEIVGDAMAQAFQDAPDKRNGAWIAVAGWQHVTFAILDHLAHVPDLPEPEVPERIALLRQLATK